MAEAAFNAAGSGTLTTDEEVPRRIVCGGPLNAVPGAGGEVRARSFIEQIQIRLDLSPADVLVLERHAHSLTADHFLFVQRHHGLPVLGSFVAVHLDRAGRVRLAVNETRPRLDVEVTPRILREDALERARREVGVVGDAYHAPPEAELAVSRDGFLVWRVLLPAEEPFGDWEVIVDAIGGAIVTVDDLVVRYVTGQGDIFDPNPVVSLQTQTLFDQNDDPAAIPPGAYLRVPLLGLDPAVGGVYYLRGEHCSIQDFELPMTARAVNGNPNGFVYNRGDDRFEEVSVYYHIDSAMRRLRTLGFDGILTHSVVSDAHGLNGADNSHYVPSTGRLAYGDGCVDDGEDAEVIWHELGHAIQNDQVPGWVGTGESGALGEGFSDFFAAALSEPVSNGYGVEQLFDWDLGPMDGCWSGRRVDSTKHYPEDMTGEVHADGEIWSAVLWQIAQGLGPDRALTLVIESHWMVPLGGTFEDGVVALLMGDDLLYAGVDIPLILDLFEERGIISQSDFAPAISHDPPPSTEDTIGPYVITAQVSNYAPIPPDSVRLVYSSSGGAFVSVAMAPTGTPNEYGVSLPGAPLGTAYEYYFRATDFAGLTTRYPATDGVYFTFSVWQDAGAPQITHTAILDAPYGTWPPTLSAVVTDSHGVDSVTVTVRVDGDPIGTFPVPRVAGTNTYRMDFPADASQVSPSNWVEYRLTARDASEARNTSYSPGPSQYYGFSVLDAAGRALVVDDDTGGTPILTTDLLAAGFLVTTVTPGTLSSAMLAAFDFVGWAAGNNLQPVASAGSRGIIEEYVGQGGKLVIEGGEVGFDAVTLYPSFATNVLHILTFGTHSGGNLRPFPWKKTHPVLYKPNVLPSTITFNYAGYVGNQDVVRPAPEATLLVENVGLPRYVGPGYAGILVYDDNDAPQSGQVVYCAFNIGQVSDTNVRRNLVSNIGHYLVAKEGLASSLISGTVSLVGGPLDRSGTVVRSLSDDAIAFTAADGSYVLGGLYSTPQLLEISHAGYETVQLVGLLPPEGGTLGGATAELRPVDTFSSFTTPYQAIPDNNATGISSSVVCSMVGTVHDVLLSVVVHHSYIGDLILDLRSPAGTTVRLHNRTGKGEDNIITTFDTERVPDGPGSLADFAGQPTQGTWLLTVSDNAAVETGTLDSWTLMVTSLLPTTGSPGPEAPPAHPRLEPPVPNPAAGSAELAYSVPRDGIVRLAVYDLTGREVAVLADGLRPAGRHRLFWDGRDSSGRRVGAGVYFCRLRAEGVEETRKLVLLD